MLLLIDRKTRLGRIQRQIRRALIAAGGMPVRTRQLLRRCYPHAKRFEWNIGRVCTVLHTDLRSISSVACGLRGQNWQLGLDATRTRHELLSICKRYCLMATIESATRQRDLAKFTELGRYWIRLGARCFITSRVGSLVMAIYRIFQTIAFEPEAIATMSAAYEQALRVLQLANRQDPITELCQEGYRGGRHRRARPPENLRTNAAGFGNA